MSDQAPSSSAPLHLSIAIVAATLAVFFWSQIGAANRNTETMHWQLENCEKQIKELKDADKQLSEMVEKRKELVAQSQQIQGKFTELFNDVLDLAKTDEDTAKVVEKWRIQRNAPAEGDKEKKIDK